MGCIYQPGGDDPTFHQCKNISKLIDEMEQSVVLKLLFWIREPRFWYAV